MLNMNSPVVQNMTSKGFNPYNNTDQKYYYGNNSQTQQSMYYQGYNPYGNTIQQTNCYQGYNPYGNNIQQQEEIEYNYYDPMPQVIINESRNIHSVAVNPVQRGNINLLYNPQAFNGYVNPYLMKNQMEAEKLRQREIAIQQGKICRILLGNLAKEDSDIDLDEMVKGVESMYYNEPVVENIPIKEKIIMDKNQHFGELEARLEYCRNNNIPMYDNKERARYNFYSYYNHINDIIGDPDKCDIVDYFTRVYPQLRQEQLDWESKRFSKNLKNGYISNNYNKILDQHSSPNSYYEKIMKTFADTGVKLTDNDGLTITPDEMEIKVPSRLLNTNRTKYMEQRQKFFDSVIRKE